MDEDTEPQEQFEAEVEEQIDDVVDDVFQEQPEEPVKQVPLSALQKERKKRQELEYELNQERQQRQQQQREPEEDRSYESATRGDLQNAQNEAVRIIEERIWIKNNPELFEMVKENLPKFLNQRPNLASAINGATNRYEEAYTLMEALSPKQKAALQQKQQVKREAPGSPSSIPKSTAMNQAIDVMTLSDSEYQKWRQDQKRRR